MDAGRAKAERIVSVVRGQPSLQRSVSAHPVAIPCLVYSSLVVRSRHWYYRNMTGEQQYSLGIVQFPRLVARYKQIGHALNAAAKNDDIAANPRPTGRRATPMSVAQSPAAGGRHEGLRREGRRRV